MSNDLNGAINGFSNIDLNGSTQLHQEMPLDGYRSATNEYTSFGESINGHQHAPTRSTTMPFSTTTTSLDINGTSHTVNGSSPFKSSSFSNDATTNGHGSANILVTGTNGSNTSSMLASATEASTRFAMKTATTLGSLKQWSKSAYKCTRQLVSEKMGKTTKTVDPEIESQIECLRETKRKYEKMLELSKILSIQYTAAFETQKQLADLFSDLAQKSPELIDECNINAETHRQIFRNGEILIKNLNSFTSSLNTLCYKTMVDTLLTIRNYEAARLEYDANRYDLEALQSQATRNDKTMQQISSLEQELRELKAKYEGLKSDVEVKMRFLNENRLKVMSKQLMLLQHAVHFFYTGSQQELDKIMKQFNNASEMKPSSNQEHTEDNNNNKFVSFLEHD